MNSASGINSNAGPSLGTSHSANTTAVSLGLTNLNYGPGGGADEATQTLTYTITGIPSSITLWKSTDSTQVKSGDTLSLKELRGLMYKTVANANNNAPAYVKWTVTDNGNPPASSSETGIIIKSMFMPVPGPMCRAE